MNKNLKDPASMRTDRTYPEPTVPDDKVTEFLDFQHDDTSDDPIENLRSLFNKVAEELDGTVASIESVSVNQYDGGYTVLLEVVR